MAIPRHIGALLTVTLACVTMQVMNHTLICPCCRAQLSLHTKRYARYVLRAERAPVESAAASPSVDCSFALTTYLTDHGCTSERDLYRALHLAAGDVISTVDLLVTAGTVRVTGGRPRLVHLATDCRCEQTAPQTP
jgi:hypothetical protein